MAEGRDHGAGLDDTNVVSDPLGEDRKGSTYETVLEGKIVHLGTAMGLQDQWIRSLLRHAISEFSEKGLGPDYYGYHNIDHELEAAYFTMIAANGQPNYSRFTEEEIGYLFVAALFHDYDPLKQFDKPHEDSVERFIRSDPKIVGFIQEIGLDIDLVIAIIHRTAYPFTGEIAEHAQERMDQLFESAGIPKDNHATRKRFTDLGWFLSVSERIAGYALGDFDHATDLARKNAHALDWNPSVINERSVAYFASLMQETEMFYGVIAGVPEDYRRRFYDNVEAFMRTWNEEQHDRGLAGDSLLMVAVPEENGKKPSPETKESILTIYKQGALPMKTSEDEFLKSLIDEKSILITLRLSDPNGKIVGFAKGAPLETSRLRRGTTDVNMGKANTAFLQGIGVKKGYSGASGGHLLRLAFIGEASRQGYKFVTGYASRDVVMRRLSKGEKMEIVQKYDPDRLDYYRADLSDAMYRTISSNPNIICIQN
jgi:hypothetical protein